MAVTDDPLDERRDYLRGQIARYGEWCDRVRNGPNLRVRIVAGDGNEAQGEETANFEPLHLTCEDSE